MYTSLPQGGHYVSFDFWHFRPFAGTGLSSYKYNIYYIYYKRRNPTKPNETYRKHFFPTFSQRNQPKPKMSFCDVVSLHRENTKNAFFQFTGPVWLIRASCFYELRLWGRFACKVLRLAAPSFDFVFLLLAQESPSKLGSPFARSSVPTLGRASFLW